MNRFMLADFGLIESFEDAVVDDSLSKSTCEWMDIDCFNVWYCWFELFDKYECFNVCLKRFL